MREYDHLSFLEQVNLFEMRGMIIEDKSKAEQKLRFISYYKLKELAYPFYVEKEGRMQYTNISFDTLIKRYYQDKRLRTSILYCLEKN